MISPHSSPETPPEGSGEPENNFGFLIHDVARLLRRAFDRRAQGLGFTRAQWSVIAHLRHNEGINQAGLADRMEIEPITLVRLLDRLEQAGLVERRPDPADRRAHRLYLTPKAAPTLDQMKTMGQALKAEALTGISDAERDQLVGLLRRLKGNLLQLATDSPTQNTTPQPAADVEGQQVEKV